MVLGRGGLFFGFSTSSGAKPSSTSLRLFLAMSSSRFFSYAMPRCWYCSHVSPGNAPGGGGGDSPWLPMSSFAAERETGFRISLGFFAGTISLSFLTGTMELNGLLSLAMLSKFCGSVYMVEKSACCMAALATLAALTAWASEGLIGTAMATGRL